MQTTNFGYIWLFVFFFSSACLHPANAAYCYTSHLQHEFIATMAEADAHWKMQIALRSIWFDLTPSKLVLGRDTTMWHRTPEPSKCVCSRGCRSPDIIILLLFFGMDFGRVLFRRCLVGAVWYCTCDIFASERAKPQSCDETRLSWGSGALRWGGNLMKTL